MLGLDAGIQSLLTRHNLGHPVSKKASDGCYGTQVSSDTMIQANYARVRICRIFTAGDPFLGPKVVLARERKGN